MKKTWNVNLGGMVYQIDEDAYQELKDYLQDVKSHLGEEASSEEVLNDVEQRIGELFTQWMQGRRQVVTVLDVRKVIQVLGRPDQYDATKNAASDNDAKNESKNQAASPASGRRPRRLYRDTDNAFVGGVCAGFAAYLNVGIVWVRLVYLLFFCFGGTGLFFYLVCWVIIPEAKTVAQRLEMQGENVTIENIEKKVREEYDRVKDRVEDYVHSSRMRQNFQSVGSGLIEFVRLCVKVFLAVIGGAIGLAGLLVLVVIILFLMMVWTRSVHFIAPWSHEFHFFQEVFLNPPSATWVTLGVLLTVGVPFVAIFRLLFGRTLNMRPASRWEIWLGFVLWFIGIGLCVYCGAGLLSHFGGIWI